MKIVVIGGTGTIGSAVVSLLSKDHNVISVGRTNGDYQMDIENKASIEKVFNEIGEIDGIISTSGSGVMGSFLSQSDEDIELAINTKLTGQMNLIRVGVHTVKENGFILVTTGTANKTPMPGASSIAMANAGLEGYVHAINIEKFNGVKINVVSPVFVKETAEMMNLAVPNTISAADTATVYKMVMESEESGIIAEVGAYLKQVNIVG